MDSSGKMTVLSDPRTHGHGKPIGTERVPVGFRSLIDLRDRINVCFPTNGTLNTTLTSNQTVGHENK